MNYLLDTNTWIALLHKQNAEVLAELKRRPSNEILLCSIVLAELWYGAERSEASRRPGNYLIVNELLAKYRSLPFDDSAAREYAVIRAELSRQGNPIGPNDTMIAAIARSQGVTLVTSNVDEFRRVPGLLMLDWQTS